MRVLVDEPKVPKVMLFASAHLRLLLGAIHVVIAAEVEDPVSQEMSHLGVERMPDRTRLALGCRIRDSDVTEEFLAANCLYEVIGLIGKRKDIGRFIDAKELVIQLPDLLVIDDDDGETRPFFDPFPGHDPHRQVMESLDIESRGFYGDFDADVVGKVVVHVI